MRVHAHLWTVHDSRTLSRVAQWDYLTDHEYRRAEHLKNTQSRSTFLATHNLMRLAVSRYTGVHPQYLIFDTTPEGKPYLKNGAQNVAPLFVSLSHTDQLACVLVANVTCGIDAERIRPVQHVEPIIDWIASDEETYRCLPQATSQRFLSLWTLKESLIKAHGCAQVHKLRQYHSEYHPCSTNQNTIVTHRRDHSRVGFSCTMLLHTQHVLAATFLSKHAKLLTLTKYALIKDESRRYSI